MEHHQSIHIGPSDQREREALVRDSTVRLIIDHTIGGADMYGGINSLAPGGILPIHWHNVGETQYILSGKGSLLRENLDPRVVVAGDCIFSPPGRHGSHGYINMGSMPLCILFFYPSPGGKQPQTWFV